jgi:hypothetical protein
MASPSAVGVGRHVHHVDLARLLLQVVEDLLLAADGHVLGSEVVLDVDAELGGGEIHDVAVAGHDREAAAEELGKRLGLRGDSTITR